MYDLHSIFVSYVRMYVQYVCMYELHVLDALDTYSGWEVLCGGVIAQLRVISYCLSVSRFLTFIHS